jgi:peptidoglycan/LPS O-acetylase OafA/YrhL
VVAAGTPVRSDKSPLGDDGAPYREDVAEPADSAWDTPVSSDARPHFRPDIEGLRAVAILAVLAYHARVPGLPGGFVGVDVFFVISGFLITGLLLRERDATGRIDLPGFYARRARRLLPAALAVVAVTVAVAAFVISPVRFPDVAADGAAAALYVSNYRFALSATDYFAADAPPSPLLHFWSLGVEEQFYLLWPLLLIVAVKLGSRGSVWRPVIAVAAASLVLSIVVTSIEAPWAFYSLPTRAWQIAFGALIAIGAARLAANERAPAFMGALAVAGIVLIVAAIVLVNDTTPYPGLAATLPAIGAGLLLVTGARADLPSTRLLASPVPRWFGRISYSLYLWHWPILILGAAVLGRNDLPARIGLALVCIAVAAASTRFIEQPFRANATTGVRVGRTLALSGAVSLGIASVVMAASGTFTRPPSGTVSLDVLPNPSDAMPRPLTPVVSGPVPEELHPSLIEARTDRDDLGADDCQTPTTDSTLRDCSYGDPAGGTTVVLFGDSHAAMWLPALERIATERDWRIVPLVKFSCPPVNLTVWDNHLKRAFHECDAWRSAALARIDELHPSMTIVVTSHGYQVADAGGDPVDAERRRVAWREGLVETLTQTRRASSTVVLIGDSPHLDDDPLDCLATSAVVESCTPPRVEVVNRAYEALEASVVQETRVGYFHAADWLCPDGACPLVMDNLLVYRDRGHLTATITEALAPRLLWELDRLP